MKIIVHSATWLFPIILNIPKRNNRLRQTVYDVKDSSAAFSFEGKGLLSSSRLNAASVDLLIVRTQAEWSNQHWRCAHIVYQFGKFRKFWFYATNLTSRSPARTSSCHERYCEWVFNDAAIRSNSTEDGPKTVPEIGWYGQNKIHTHRARTRQFLKSGSIG